MTDQTVVQGAIAPALAAVPEAVRPMVAEMVDMVRAGYSHVGRDGWDVFKGATHVQVFNRGRSMAELEA